MSDDHRAAWSRLALDETGWHTFSRVGASHLAALPNPTQSPTAMTRKAEPTQIPDERLTIEKRSDGAIVVRVQSEGPPGSRLPDAVFSFRCGDPQYAYWLGRLDAGAMRR
jgi:hypothetical protein